MRFIDLVTVIIRVLTLWLLVVAAVSLLTHIDAVLAMLMQVGVAGASLARAQFGFLVGTALVSALYALSAIGLFLLAPRIARFSCRELKSATAELDVTSVGSDQVYHIAMVVSGIVILVGTIQPVAQMLARILSVGTGFPGPISWVSAGTIGIVFMVFARLLLSGLLIVGAKPIGDWLARLRYDPADAAGQRFSLRALLILFTIMAVVLLLAKAMMY